MKCLSIHLTDLCNSKCSFCVVGSPLYAKDSIRHEEVLNFLRANAGQSYDVVNIHGGEATVHPRFLETLEAIRDLGYGEVHLQTNGITIAAMEFARRLVSLGVTLFIVSLHGDSAALQDELTDTPGGFDKTIQGIRNAKQLDAKVRTNTVITRQNVARLSAIVGLACDLGVDHINLSNLHPTGSAYFGINRLSVNFRTVRENMYDAVDAALALGRAVTLEGFPYCVVREKSELHLNNMYRDIKMLMRSNVINNYDQFMNNACRVFGEPCERCTVRERCGGAYPEYVQFHGWHEFAPIAGPEARASLSAAE